MALPLPRGEESLDDLLRGLLRVDRGIGDGWSLSFISRGPFSYMGGMAAIEFESDGVSYRAERESFGYKVFREGGSYKYLSTLAITPEGVRDAYLKDQEEVRSSLKAYYDSLPAVSGDLY